VIGDPFAAGAAKVTRSDPAATLTAVGVAGGAGAPTITGSVGEDAALVPRLFVAVTEQVASSRRS
jgi:hypothetical protein